MMARFRRRHMLGMMGAAAFWPVSPLRAAPPLRAPLPPDSTIAFTGHSMIAALFDADDRAYNAGVDFPSLWQGPTLLDFIGWSSNARRWRAMGHARTGRYDRLVMTDLGDLDSGLPHPASAEGRQNLQHLYWFAMTAIAKGAEPVLYMPWSPVVADLDDAAQPILHYERQWLERHTGHRIWIIPAGLFARALRDRTADDPALFVDGVHWRPDGPAPTGLAYLTYQFFAMQRVPAPSLFPETEELAWQVLQDYHWAGFGGQSALPALEIEDPLPDPAPLP